MSEEDLGEKDCLQQNPDGFEELEKIVTSVFNIDSFKATDYQLSLTEYENDEYETDEPKDYLIVPTNDSKSKRRVIIKAPKNLRGPYLNFGLEEEFIVFELHEAYHKVENEIISYYLEYKPVSYMKNVEAFLETLCDKSCSLKSSKTGYEEAKNVIMKMFSKLGNSLIPSKFGKFPDRFLVNILEYSFDIYCQLGQAIIASVQPDYSDLFTLYTNEWSCENKNLMEENLIYLKDYPSVKFEDLRVFKSTWCASYDDEQFYTNTIKELGLYMRRYPRILGIAYMMSIVVQPDYSPFSKSLNLKRFPHEKVFGCC